jgi:AcrR family transcriptional regulator
VSQQDQDDLWRPPRGRHGLPREVIEHSQRQRLLAATMRVVAAKGYAATTVADLTKEAGISRTTFYALFDDKESCFLAAYDDAVDRLVHRVTAAYDGAEPWPDRLRAGLESMLRALAENPAQARMALVDVAAAGPAAQRRYRTALQRLIPFFDKGRDYVPEGSKLPANTSRMAIGALVGLISDELVAGRGEQLPALQSDLLFATLVAYLGPDEAAREARGRERSR